MPVTARLNSELTVDETIDINSASLASAYSTLRHNAFNTSLVLDANSDIKASQVAAFELSLSAGAGQIDLVALLGTNGAVVDGTGLKVQAIKLIADAENSAAITVSEAASNGYELLGSEWTLDLLAGQDLLVNAAGVAAEISATARLIDLSSGDLTAKLNVIVLMGE